MALEGVKSEKCEENNGNLPDGKGNGTDNKSKQVYNFLFLTGFYGFLINITFSILYMNYPINFDIFFIHWFLYTCRIGIPQSAANYRFSRSCRSLAVRSV